MKGFEEDAVKGFYAAQTTDAEAWADLTDDQKWNWTLLYRRAPAEPAAPDMVSHPPHYTSHPSGVEPIEITRHESFCLGNVLKYCMRAKYKGNEIQDLRKAAQYLQWEIERLEGKS